VTRNLVVLMLLFAMALGVHAQQQPSQQKATAPDEIYSGTVTASSADSLAVLRKVSGRPDETRTFLIDKDTKIEGKLKVSARVTVRFSTAADGALHALRVIIRADSKASPGAGKAPAPGPGK